jgi:hypothetical protein
VLLGQGHDLAGSELLSTQLRHEVCTELGASVGSAAKVWRVERPVTALVVNVLAVQRPTQVAGDVVRRVTVQVAYLV